MTVREAVQSGNIAVGKNLVDSKRYLYGTADGTGDSWDPAAIISPDDLRSRKGFRLVIARVGKVDYYTGEEIIKDYPAVFVNNEQEVFIMADIADENFVGYHTAGAVSGGVAGITTGTPEGSLWGSLFGELGGEGLFKVNNPFYLVDDIENFFKDLWDSLIKALKDSLEKYWMIILIILIIVIAYFLLSTTGTGLAIYQSLKN